MMRLHKKLQWLVRNLQSTFVSFHFTLSTLISSCSHFINFPSLLILLPRLPSHFILIFSTFIFSTTQIGDGKTILCNTIYIEMADGGRVWLGGGRRKVVGGWWQVVFDIYNKRYKLRYLLYFYTVGRNTTRICNIVYLIWIQYSRQGIDFLFVTC